MSDNAINWLFKIGFGLLALLLAGGVWYYTMGRKPHLIVSVPLKPNESSTIVRAVGPDEVLLLAGTKATLYDLKTKGARWSANLSALATPAAATPAPKAIAKAAATPAPAPQEKPDPLLAARVKKRFAKLEKWAAELNDKRGKLKTQLQIEAFNAEAAKYHAELIAARAEAATLNPAHREPAEDEAERFFHHSYLPARTEIATLGGSVWIAQGNHVTGFDRADGRVLKNLALPGNVSSIERGADELFVLASIGNGGEMQVSRIAPGSAAAQSFNVSIPPEPREEEWHQGRPRTPTTPGHRIVFSANRSQLLKLDVRLIEKNLSERQTMSGEAGSDLEAADKKTTGGVGNDALLFAQALSREAERDATGGKEIIDESTYEIALHRPFAPATPDATAQIHGRAEIFSTPTLDLIPAGNALGAFDQSK